MADSKMTAVENIFRNAVTLIGYERAVEILKTMEEKPVEEKPKKADEKPKKAEEKPKKAEGTKRIQRMSPNITAQLKAELTKVGLNYSEDDKKEFEKVKKEFVAYVDDLTEKDFAESSLTDHMRDFANTKKPAEAAVKVEEKQAEEKPKEKPKKASKKTEKVVAEKPMDPPSNAAPIHDLSLKELQAIEMIATPGGEPTGTFWDADNGRWVRGPDADSDEDIVEQKFQGKTYMVGEKSGRVYEETDNRDVFHGFVGVGKFKDMKMP